VNDGIVTVKAPFGIDKKTIDNITLKHSRWIEKTIEREKKNKNLIENLSKERIKALKTEAKGYFKATVEKYSNILRLYPKDIRITSAMHRFGSCSSEGIICFSFRLMLYPEIAREYVVVHELCHLRYMNHSLKFYNLVKTVFPNYKEIARQLK
jgi:predicted metal-dependent hydrolase